MHIWQRLCWKELRESSPFVLIGVSLPLLCLAFPEFRDDFVMLPIVIIIVLVAVWSAARTWENHDSGLPISVPLRLVSRYLLPVVGVSLIGASLGCLMAFRQYNPMRLDMIPQAVGICLFVYVLSMVVSSIYTMIPAVIAGLFLAMFSITDAYHSASILGMQLRILFVVLITALYWEGYRGKRRVLIGRIAFPLLMTLALCWGSIRNGDIADMLRTSSSSSSESTLPVIAVENFHDTDGTLTLSFNDSQNQMICLSDGRIPRRYVISPDRIAPPGDYLRSMNCLDRHVVLFAVQAPKDTQVRIVAWDACTGQVTERFRFTGWPGMMANGCYTRHSSDNRYLIFGMHSAIGTGDDLWLLDMQNNRATLVVPNAERRRYDRDRDDASLQGVITTPDRLILQLEMRNLSVDLHTLHVTPLQIGDMR